MGKKPIVSVTYENETISIKNYINIVFLFSFFVVRHFRLSLLNNFYCNILHLYNIVLNSYHKFSNISKPEEDWYGQPNILNIVVKKHTRYYDLLCSHH